MVSEAAHYYRKFRAHGDEPLFHSAVAAWNSARSFVYFRKTLRADVAASAKRSKSAKKAWKTRRANTH